MSHGMGIDKSGVKALDSISRERYFNWLTVAFLSVAFFCIIGSYTVAKEIKNSVFAYIVGREWIPIARWFSMVVLIPPIFLYSALVDKMRRYWLLCLYCVFYGVMGLVFTYFLGHPTIGLANTNTNQYRLFGWLLYFFVEGFSPFVIGVFWAFANSISSPQDAKDNYGWLVSASKFGGVVCAGLAWILLTTVNGAGDQLCSDVLNHQILLGGSSLILFIVPLVLICMMKKVPGRYLHGYEAAYKLEKKKKKEGKAKTGIFEGFKMLLRYPYVMGIFGMAFFYEACSTVLSYMSIGIAQQQNASMSQALRYLMEIIFVTHLVGLVISLVGTRVLFNWLGTRRCLLLVPASAGLAFLFYMLSPTNAQAVLVTFVLLRSINYAFSWPLRESLYIPTVKEIKFKSKSWIDAFGSKFSKSYGSAFNLLSGWLGTGGMLMYLHSAFFAVIVFFWFITAYLLGKRFDVAVKNNEVIGADS